MNRILSTALVILFLSFSAFGEEKKEEPKKEDEQQSQQEKAKADYQKAQLAAAEKYGKILDAEVEKATKAGNLDLVTEIQKEKEAISSAETTASDKDWKKLKSLALAEKNFNDDLKKAKKNYISVLEKVVVELTKQKKFDDAKLIRDHIEELKNEEIIVDFCGKWKESSGVIHTFNIDRTAKYENGKEVNDGKWLLDGDTIVVKWNNGWVMNIKIKDFTKNKITMMNHDPSGKIAGPLVISKEK